MPKVRVCTADGALHEIEATRFVAMDSGFVVLVGRFPDPQVQNATQERDVAIFYKPQSVVAHQEEKQVAEPQPTGFHRPVR